MFASPLRRARGGVGRVIRVMPAMTRDAGGIEKGAVMGDNVNRALFRQVALVVLAAILAGCGSSHHGGTTTPTDTPVISNLDVVTSAQGCTVQGLSGRARKIPTRRIRSVRT